LQTRRPSVLRQARRAPTKSPLATPAIPTPPPASHLQPARRLSQDLWKW
jgi:hypothetical protein